MTTRSISEFIQPGLAPDAKTLFRSPLACPPQPQWRRATRHFCSLLRGGANSLPRISLVVHTPLYAEVPRTQDDAYE